MLKSVGAMLLLSLVAVAAQAQTPAGQAPTAVQAPAQAKSANTKSDLDRVVCEKQDTIGTRLGARKVCMTVAQWQEFQREQQGQMLHIEQNIGLVAH